MKCKHHQKDFEVLLFKYLSKYSAVFHFHFDLEGARADTSLHLVGPLQLQQGRPAQPWLIPKGTQQGPGRSPAPSTPRPALLLALAKPRQTFRSHLQSGGQDTPPPPPGKGMYVNRLEHWKGKAN